MLRTFFIICTVFMTLKYITLHTLLNYRDLIGYLRSRDIK